jgi:hypothetical protein
MPLAASHGVQHTHTELSKPDGYVFTVRAPSSSLFIVGGDAEGAFYGTMTLASIVNNTLPTTTATAVTIIGAPRSSTISIESWRIFDYPDLPLRGAEMEGSVTVNIHEWHITVGTYMAAYKLNFLVWSTGQPGFSVQGNGSIVPAGADQVALLKLQLAYFDVW